ncbi:MAG TPA: efflux transporter outer membrane subunit [Candidatus Acidoferrales bacterium]|nr:efflux transporter outer membrane subunit [Candidatus Acidoferrales bacterium]
MTRLPLIACGAALALAGCSVGPDYHRPAPLPSQPAPTSFSNGGTNAMVWKIAEPSAGLPRGDWWQIFGDSELSRLEVLALTNNQNVAAAVSRLEQARQLVAASRSQFYPQLAAGGTPGGDITRQRTSVNEPELGQPAGAAHTYNTFTAPVYLGWELDLWGRVRRLSEAAHERFVATADDLESSKLDVTAEVAVDYFSLQTLDDEYSLITNTIEAYRRSLELTQNRRRGGIVSDLDVAQAATQLHSAEVELPAIRLHREQTEHALAILCGESPIDFSAATNLQRIAAVPAIPPGVPAELLEHRPDIAAAERRVAAANADVGVAKAAFFPAVTLNGVAGLQSVSASSWFDWPSRFWSVGPSIELPLFTGGRNTANLARTRAAYDETVADYRQTVLGAFGEVEDSLAAQAWLADEWEAENLAVKAAQHALDIANNRYRAGLITYLDVATAQTEALNEERNAVDLQGARLTACVNFIKALGSGWTNPN